jgi:hypothetical protein
LLGSLALLTCGRRGHDVAIGSGSVPDAAPALPAGASYLYGQTVTLPDVPSLTGYTFSGWSTTDAEIQDGAFLMPAQAVQLTGSWVPRTDTPFTIKYFQQDLDGDDYSLADTVEGIGTTDAAIPDAHKDYTGFTETADSVSAESSTPTPAPSRTLRRRSRKVRLTCTARR